jgi:hypothetical protein
METTVNEYVLTCKGKEIFKGTKNECYVKLQSSQSQSADWAMKYEGWNVKPTGKQIKNPIVILTCVKLYGYKPVVVFKGKLMIVDPRAMYGHPSVEVGDLVKADSKYFSSYDVKPDPGTYINPFYSNGNTDSRPFYKVSPNPTIYKGYEIHERYDREGIKLGEGGGALVWDVVKDGIIITMRAGLNGAKKFIDETINNA